MSQWVQLIEVAGKSTYTLAALALLVLYNLAAIFFRKERAAVKLLAFLSLVSLVGLPIVGHYLRPLGKLELSVNTGTTTVTGDGNAVTSGQNNCAGVTK